MDNLSECVEALKNVRRCMQSDADPCIVTALDEAIAKLERCKAEGGRAEPDTIQAGKDALAVISDILTCCGAVAELVKFFSA